MLRSTPGLNSITKRPQLESNAMNYFRQALEAKMPTSRTSLPPHRKGGGIKGSRRSHSKAAEKRPSSAERHPTTGGRADLAGLRTKWLKLGIIMKSWQVNVIKLFGKGKQEGCHRTPPNFRILYLMFSPQKAGYLKHGSHSLGTENFKAHVVEAQTLYSKRNHKNAFQS